MSEDPQYLADRAVRLMEEIEPSFARLEKAALDAAVAQHWQHKEGGENVHRLLERASVIRALRVDLHAMIAAGEIAGKNAPDEDGAPRADSPYA